MRQTGKYPSESAPSAQGPKPSGLADKDRGSRGSRPGPTLTQSPARPGPALLRNPGAAGILPAHSPPLSKSRSCSPAPELDICKQKGVALHRRGRKDTGAGTAGHEKEGPSVRC